MRGGVKSVTVGQTGGKKWNELAKPEDANDPIQPTPMSRQLGGRADKM